MTELLTAQLRPHSIVELVDQGVRLYRRYFLKFTGMVAVALLPILILQILSAVLSAAPLLTQQFNDTLSPFATMAMFGSLAAQTGSGLLTFFLINGVAAAVLTRAIADHYLGEPVGLWATFRKIGSQWIQLLIVLVLAYLFGIVLLVWFIIPCIGWFTGGGMLMFYYAAVVPLLVPVVLLERKQALTAVRRAWELARLRFWPILGLGLVLGLLQQAISIGPVMALAAVYLWALSLAVTSNNSALLVAAPAVFQTIVLVFTTLLFVPVQMATMMTLYFDLRVRGEGLDLALQAQHAAGEAPVAEALTETPVASGPWFRDHDWRNFLLVSLIFIGLMVGVIVLYVALLAGIGTGLSRL
jgi:hypothetical protein